MNQDQVTDVVAQLAKTFPEHTLTPEQIAVFASRIERYEAHRVKGAITDHFLFDDHFKNPKINKIMERLQNSSDVDETAIARGKSRSPYVSIIAQQMARDNAACAGKPEAELIAAYHRHYWVEWLKSQLNRLPPSDVKLSPEQARIVAAQWARIDQCRETTRRACAIDVSNALAITFQQAEPWGAVAVADEKDFARLLATARGENVMTELNDMF